MPIRDALVELQATWGSFEVVEGAAAGADTLARQAARDLGLPVREFRANWQRYGKAAGALRNQQMLDYLLEADQRLVLAFPLPQSRGTWDMVQRAKRVGIETRVFAPNN